MRERGRESEWGNKLVGGARVCERVSAPHFQQGLVAAAFLPCRRNLFRLAGGVHSFTQPAGHKAFMQIHTCIYMRTDGRTQREFCSSPLTELYFIWNVPREGLVLTRVRLGDEKKQILINVVLRLLWVNVGWIYELQLLFAVQSAKLNSLAELVDAGAVRSYDDWFVAIFALNGLKGIRAQWSAGFCLQILSHAMFHLLCMTSESL
jgi:hypothetical protein